MLPRMVALGVTVALLGTCACTRDVVRAIAVGCRDTGRDTTGHPGAFADDTPRVAGAGSPARCKQFDRGDSGNA